MTAGSSQIELHSQDSGHSEEPAQQVSGRFLTDLFGVLERHQVPAFQLLGDLPVPRGDHGAILEPVEWPIFVEFMTRLERHVGGPEGIEACGGLIGELKPATALRGLAGLTASPFLLYRGAIRWALQRALPGIETHISTLRDNQFEIHARLADRLRSCPQIFHFATGGARALPRILGMAEAVVSARIGESEATYRITLPPSLTLFARAHRALRSVFSAGAVLESLESQQLELHAQHAALQRAHAALAASEQLYRARTDAAADMLCELDTEGRVVYVSASVQDLMGYTPEQVMGSHYRLWIPKAHHALANARFEALAGQPAGQRATGGLGVCQELLTLHARHRRKIRAEISIRSYETPDGEWRMVGILRDMTGRLAPAYTKKTGAGTKKTGAGAETTGASTADPITSLRARLARFQHPRARADTTGTADASDQAHAMHHDHPLHRSLGILIASLERNGCDAEATQAVPLTEAARRMTQIVDGALVHAQAPETGADWIDLRKLLDTVRADLDRGERGGSGERVMVPASRWSDASSEAAPGQVWGRLDLLVNALASLAEYLHAADASPGGARPARPAGSREPIQIETRVWDRDAGPPGVEFRLSRPERPERPQAGPRLESPNDPSGGDPQTGEAGQVSALSLAIATDAVAVMKGEILLEERGHAGEAPGMIRLRLPQPASRGALSQIGSQSSSRTMSAPSEVSFSSTRS